MASNPALQDIEEISTTRPELTAEEWETVAKAQDWIKATLKPDIRKELESEYEDRYKSYREEMEVATKQGVAEAMEDWRKAQTPLSEEEYKQLLAQEYLSFKLTLGRGEQKEFTIQELSARDEKKIIESAKKYLVPLIEQLNAADWNIDGELGEAITGMIAAVPSALDAAADIVAIILDPKGEQGITQDWVLANVSLSRIAYIIQAQSEANRYRDFFSNVSRTFRASRTAR